MSRVRPHLLMGDRGMGNLRLLNGLAIEAYPALFPCKISPACSQPLGRGSRHFLEESRPLARARIKELSLRDLAARAQRQQ